MLLVWFLFVISYIRLQPSAATSINVPLSTSTPVNLRRQAFTRNMCLVAPEFAVSTQKGKISVSCIKSENDLDNLLLSLYRLKRVTAHEFTSARDKGFAYLRRDGYLTACFLTCARGRPYHPAPSLTSPTPSEPAGINFGCDNFDRFQCTGDICPSSIYNVRNGSVSCTEVSSLGTVCRLQCDPGYAEDSFLLKICNETTRSWIPESPFRCRESCPYADLDFNNGIVSCNDTTFEGSVCTVRCKRGYKSIFGDSVTTCRRGSWTPAPFMPICIKVPTCRELPKIENGRIICADDNYLLSRCYVTCDEGYSPGALKEQWCLPEGNDSASWGVFNRDNVPRSTGSDERMTCHHRPQEVQNLCDIRPQQRANCGNNRVTRELCVHYGCCWDDAEPTFPCYRLQSTPINETVPVPESLLTSSQSRGTAANIQLFSGSASRFITATFHRNDGTSNSRRIPSHYNHRSYTRPACGCNTMQSGLPTGPQCSLRRKTSKQDVSSSAPTNGTGSGARNDVQPRVYGGTPARPENWPWHAVVYSHPQLCGGTLIRNDLVLTAAHCVTGEEGTVNQLLTVVLGLRNISIFDSATTGLFPYPIQVRNSQRVLRHSGFRRSAVDGSTMNDIALIKLRQPVSTNSPYIKTLCLPQQRPSTLDNCYVTGFGITSSANQPSSILQQACVPIMSVTKCQTYYGGTVNPAKHICAGTAAANSPDTCRGDSGGPLVCRRRNQSRSCGWYLAGITSFGNQPCGRSSPSVFVNVFKYRRWISRHVELLDFYDRLVQTRV